MTSDQCLTGPERVVINGVNAVGPAMFNYDVFINVHPPAGMPRREVVLKMQSLHPTVFRYEIGKTGFEVEVVIARAPKPFGIWGRLKQVVKIVRDCL